MNSRIVNRYKTLLFFCPLFFYGFQCNDCKDELHDQSSFTAFISPLAESFNVCDTISIGSTFSSQIPLELSQIDHDNSNQDISFVVQIFEVKPNNNPIDDGIEDFDIVSGIGEISNSPYYDGRLAKEILNTCEAERCEFLIHVIPKKKGLYCFSLLNSRFGATECQYLSLSGNKFDVDDNNFEICDEINTSSFRLSTSGAYYSNPEEISSFYFFEVN